MALRRVASTSRFAFTHLIGEMGKGRVGLAYRKRRHPQKKQTPRHFDGSVRVLTAPEQFSLSRFQCSRRFAE